MLKSVQNKVAIFFTVLILIFRNGYHMLLVEARFVATQFFQFIFFYSGFFG